MKKRFLSIAVAAALTGSLLTSCVVRHDRYHHDHDHGHYDHRDRGY